MRIDISNAHRFKSFATDPARKRALHLLLLTPTFILKVHNTFLHTLHQFSVGYIMALKSFLQSSWFLRIVLLAWIGCSSLIFLSQKTIDVIVNKSLYSYGLQYSESWHQPYWTYANLMYYSQYACIALSIVALAFSLSKKEETAKASPMITQESLKKISVPQETNGRGIVISCSSCKKVVSKPLVMLDFTGGEAKLVNVCPYCNAVLGNAEKKDTEEIVASPDKEVIH